MTLLIVYLTVAIGVSFMCSVLEAVLLSVTPSYIETLTRNDPRRSRRLKDIKNRLDESISSILILNTFAHTMGAAGVGAQASKIFGTEWETLIAVVLTLAILYLSEIIPKTIGATFWRHLAVPASHIIFWLIRIVYPLIWVSTLLTKLFKGKDQNKITREEILSLASLGEKSGLLIRQENAYLNNVLNLRLIRTEEILTPRSVMHSLDQLTSIEDALHHEKTMQFTRIPVYDLFPDKVVGLVTNRELFNYERNGKSNVPLSDIKKPVDTVSKSLPVHHLLDLFIKKKEHLFLVEDQFGQLVGIVTLEDAIETLLGREIVDETDTVEDMQRLAKGNKKQER